MNAGCEATSKAASPALAATAHVTCPLTTPSAVKTPPRRPPASVFRIVSAVSRPGVTMTRSETPRNAATWPALTCLLDGDGLGQVARLVDVQAAQPRDAVGQQLQRHTASTACKKAGVRGT